MPVNLKQIPEEEPLPVPPDKFRWLLVIVLCVVVGAVFVLALWPKSQPTHSVWFWFCSLILPFSAGLLAYIVRLRGYENARDRVMWWNHLHQKEYDEQVLRGQLAFGVLGMGYNTPLASNKLAAALLQGGSELRTRYSAALQATVTTASLSPALTELTDTAYQSRLAKMLLGVTRQLQTELEQFTSKVSVRIHHDGVLSHEQLAELWQRVTPVPDAVELHISTGNDGLMWIDDWLDKQDESLVLSVESNVFLKERDNQSESVSALLLASPAWLTRNKVEPVAWGHRPVETGTSDDALTNAACWGRMKPGIPWFFWRTQVTGDALAMFLQATDKAGYMSDKTGELILDDAFGRPAAAMGNIALICASEHALASGQVQWLLAGDKTPHTMIVRPA